MKCSKCNNEIEEGSAFCVFCGAKVEETKEPEEPVVQSETKVEEPTQNVTEEPVVETKEEKVEEVKEEVKEVIKEESKQEVSNTEQNTANTTTSASDNGSNKKQRHSVITMAIIIVAIVVVIAIILVVALCSKSPEKLYKGIINSAVTEMYAGDGATSNSANVSAAITLSTDIGELKDYVDGLGVATNVQYNLADKQVVFGLNIDKDSDSYLALNSLVDLKENKVYLSESNLYDKVIGIDIPEEYQEVIEEYLGDDELAPSDKTIAKKAAKRVYSTIDDNLSKELFTREKVTVNINGKNKKVKDNKFTITYEELKNVVVNTTSTLKLDNSFLECYQDRNQAIELLDSIEDMVEDLDSEDITITVHYYTSGLTNKFVGVAIVMSDYYDDEVIMEVVNTSKNQYEINVKQTQYSSTETVATANLTVNKSSSKENDVSLSMNIEDEGKIELRLVTSSVYNKGINAMDLSNTVDYSEMTDEDYENIYNNFIESKLYEVFSPYMDDAMDSLGLGDDSSTNRDVPSGITLKKDQSFVESYDDDVIVFNVPTTFEEEYAGLSYQRFSKEDKTKETAYIDVDCNWDTLEEYEEYIDSNADYYRESDGYKDVKVTDREELEVNGVKFYKRNFQYTYQSGSFSFSKKVTYYYTPITDEYVYSVEIDDEDGIVTESEIQKMLTIDVTLSK